MDELETYLQKNNCKCVLLFPPLPSRLRYLIHKTTEDQPELTTFSVGESWSRRVVVCHSELRSELEDDNDFESSICLYGEPPGSRSETEGNIKPKPSVPSRSRAPKRPDQPLYMPRAARERLSLQNSHTDTESSADCCSSSSNSCSCPETATISPTSRQESCLSAVDGILDTSANSSVSCNQEKMQKQSLHENDSLVWEQTQSCFADMSLEDGKREDFAGVPHSVQTEGSETDDLLEQIKAHLKETDAIFIEYVRNDYSVYENVSLNSDDFRHVIEIYDFPAIFKTDDLLDAFTEYSDGGMKIKWVDNTHALGVFSSEAAALHALSICHPLLKARALSEGSRKAQGKALRRAEFIQPVKERPRTDCAVARRMVTRALGIRGRGRVQRY